MFEHTLSPILVDLGVVQIRWYGLFYALGFVLVYWYLNWVNKQQKMGLSKDDVSDFLFYGLIGVIVGARLFYVLFYNPLYFLSNPLEVFAVWQGGLSFHGGFVGALVAVWLFSKKKNLAFYTITDIIAVPAMISLALGRLGNWFNGELWGRVTSVSWCVEYGSNPHLANPPTGCRHPSQLYESLYSLLSGIVLYVLSTKNFAKGTVSWLFVLLYGILRFCTEFFREPDAQLGFFFGVLSMGQLLSIPMILVGGVMLVRLHNKT